MNAEEVKQIVDYIREVYGINDTITITDIPLCD